MDVIKKAKEIAHKLNSQGVRTELDDRNLYTPFRKFTYWEVRGVPIRIEIGPKDLENEVVTVCRRDINYDKNNKKPVIMINDSITDNIKCLLDEIHNNMLNKARDTCHRHIVQINTWEQFLPNLNNKNLCLAPFCGNNMCEDAIKKRSTNESIELRNQEDPINKNFIPIGAAKSLCIPFEQPNLPIHTLCFGCNELAINWTLFGRSY
jgi:prolyl-tRNA synthetase